MARGEADGTEQFDYPVQITDSHRASESVGYSGDRFDCSVIGAYMHTGAWPAWGYCPFCGGEL